MTVRTGSHGPTDAERSEAPYRTMPKNARSSSTNSSRLLERREVAAAVELVPVAQVGEPRLRPAARDAGRSPSGRSSSRLGTGISAKSRRRKLSQYSRAEDAPGARQPVEHDVVEQLVARERRSRGARRSRSTPRTSRRSRRTARRASRPARSRASAAGWTAAWSSRSPIAGSWRTTRAPPARPAVSSSEARRAPRVGRAAC